MILVLGCRENRYVVVLWKMGVMMYISRVKLYNWKNFRECDVRLSERCFVVGVLKTEDIHPPKTGISVHFSGSLV